MSSLNIVAVPFHDWKKSQMEGFRTRDAHLLQEFSQHPLVNKLLIVDRPISIAEMLILQKPLRVRDGNLLQRSGFSWLTQLGEKIFVLDTFVPQLIRPILQRRKWLPYIYGQNYIKQAVVNAIQYLDLESYVLFLSSPLPVPLYDQMNPPSLVLDAVDNLTKATGFSSMREEIDRYYQRIRRDASVIFANSIETSEWLSQGREPAIYIPNGVNPDHFHKTDRKCPDDLLKLPAPIVGYAGKMQELFDVELLCEAAESLPETSFVCIGQILNSKWMKQLWNYPNVHYLGDKHYEDLPNYLAYFDVCIIPYNIERQHGGDPIKFYEYLAAGKPVVTTNIGGVSDLSYFPQVKVVSDSEEFLSALEEIITFLHEGNTFPSPELPEDVKWSRKADMMINQIIKG